MKEKVLNILKYIIGITMVILLLVFQHHIYYAAIDITIGTLLYGIIYIIEKNRKGILALIISLSTIFSIVIYKTNILSFANAFTLFIVLNIILMVDISFIISRIDSKKNHDKYSKKIEATCVDLLQAPNTKKKYFCPVYDYEYKKNKYTVEYPIFLNKNIPKINDKLTIYVNPDDETDVYFDVSKKNLILLIGSTIIINIFCIAILVSLFI